MPYVDDPPSRVGLSWQEMQAHTMCLHLSLTGGR